MKQGETVGRWRLVAPLGQGAFGTTWRAVDQDGQPAAIKTIASPPGDELRALASICHPAVVGVLGGGTTPVPYIAMEVARGQPLDEHQATKDLPSALGIAAALADALSAVHHAGLAHGDVKPANLIVDAGEPPRVTLVDFGLAGSGRGGTLAYAAPERLSGGPAAPAADVYAVGLIFWELLHGALPWAELGMERALLKRRDEVPDATEGPPWVRELLRRVLDLEPARRPPAAELADTLAAHGARLPQPTGTMLRRRARSVYVRRPRSDTAMDAWLADGGVLTLVGPPDVGRTHSLDRLAIELSAEGRAWLRYTPDGNPWGAIQSALRDPRLGAPSALTTRQDPSERAYDAARRLRRRVSGRLHLLVDDWETLDEPSVRVLQLLVADGRVAICAAGRKPPPWRSSVVALALLDDEGVGQLMRALLGVGSERLASLAQACVAFAGGMPGRVLDLLVAVVDGEAAVRRSGTWVVDTDRLRRITDRDVPTARLVDGLSSAAIRVGLAVALHGDALDEARIAGLSGLPQGDVRMAVIELLDRHLVYVHQARVRCAGHAAAVALARPEHGAAGIHRALLDHLQAQGSAELGRMARHAIGAGDAAWAETHGAAAVQTALGRDPSEAVEMAQGIFALTPVPAVAAALIDALGAAGRCAEALAFGEAQLARHPDLSVRIALARALLHHPDHRGRAGELLALEDQALPQARRLTVYDLRIQALMQDGHTHQAIELARSATSGPPPTAGEQVDAWLSIRGTWAQAELGLGHTAEALAVADGVPAGVGTGRVSRTRFEAMRARLLWHSGRPREAGELMAACARAEGGLPALDRAGLANNAALASYSVGDVPDALSRWERARLLFERLGAVESRIAVHNNLCVGYRRTGRWERALASGKWALDAATARDQHVYRAMVAGNLGDLALFTDDLDGADAYYAIGTEAEKAAELPINERIELARRIAEMSVLRHRDDAHARVLTVIDLADEHDDEREWCRALALRAVLEARGGHPDRTRSDADAAVQGLIRIGAMRELAEARLSLAEAWRAQGDDEGCIAELARVAMYAEEVRDIDLQTRADAMSREVGTDVRVIGVPDQTEKMFEIATRVARERDLPTLLDAIAGSALELTGGDRCFVILADEAGKRVEATRLAPGHASIEPSWTLVNRAVDEGREVIVADLGERPDLQASTSALMLELRSVMVVPMLDDEQILGAIYIDSRTASERDLRGLSRYLEVLSSYGAIAVSNARHLAEAQRRAIEGAEVAHDLRNLLAAVVGIVEELSDTAVGPQVELVEDLDQTTDDILSIIKGYLEHRQADVRLLDLSALTRRLGDVLAYQTRVHGLVLEIDASVEAWILGDAEELRRALTNLVHNAVKYSPPGGKITLAVEVEGDTIVWSVRDQGEGLGEGDLARLLEQGAHGSDSLAGHGIGLAVAARAIHRAGGTLVPSNHPDGGALFYARIPASPPDATIG